MKKLWIIMLVVIFIASFSFNVMGWNERLTIRRETESGEPYLHIVKDNKTGVCYLVIDCKAVTVMYDSNGKILIEK